MSNNNNNNIFHYRRIDHFETLQRISQRRRHEIMARRSIIVPNVNYHEPILKQQILTPYESKEDFECPLTLKLHKNGYILPCNHIFSDEILKWTMKTCPCCRAKY